MRELCKNFDSEGAILLEVGCGVPMFHLATRSSWIGTDMNFSYLRAAQGGPPRFVADARILPVRSAYVDAVLFSQTSHHLSDEQWMLFMAECSRILKTDGEYIFVDNYLPPDGGSWFYRFLVAMDRGRHFRTWSRQQELLSQAGFGLIHQAFCKIGFYPFVFAVLSPSQSKSRQLDL